MMKQLTALALSLALMGTPSVQAQQSSTGSTASPKTARRRTTASSDAAVATQLSQLKQAIDAQQQQIKQLSEQLQSRDQRIQQLEQKIDQSQAAVSQAQSKADSAASVSSKQEESVNSLRNDITDLKQNATNTAVALQETQTNVKNAFESPAALHYKGITITPGGFVAAETVYRTRATSSDINTPFTGIPYTANALSRVGETNLTARQSRLSLLAEG